MHYWVYTIFIASLMLNIYLVVSSYMAYLRMKRVISCLKDLESSISLSRMHGSVSRERYEASSVVN
jgi:hypothetical protein